MKVRLLCSEEQEAVLNCTARFIGLFAGRRFGKTLGCLIPRAIKGIAENPGHRVAWVANQFKLVRQVYNTVYATCRPLIRTKCLQPTPRIDFWGGGYIDFFSFARPEGIRGWGYDDLICDEIQDFNNEDEFWSVLRPLISDRGGRMIVAGQFRGTDWRYKTFCEKGGLRWDGQAWRKDPPKPGYRSFVFPAHLGLVYQSERGKQDLADAKDQLPRVIYEQEYDCIPTANQASPFRPEDLKAITRGTPPNGPEGGKTYILAIDLGMMVDPTKWVVMSMPDRMIVDRGAARLRQKHEKTAIDVAAVRKKWGCQCVVMDTTAGAGGGKRTADEFLKFYRATIPDLRAFVWTQATKWELYKAFLLWVEKHMLSIPAEFSDVHRELQTLEYTYRNGRVDIHAQDKQHDDYPAAIGMAIQMVEKGYAGAASVSLAPG